MALGMHHQGQKHNRFEQIHVNIQAWKLNGIQPSIISNFLFLVSSFFLFPFFSMYLLHFYFIWDIGLYLRTSLHFYFYFRTYTYLQLMGDLDMYAFYIILLFFFFCFNEWKFEFKFFLSNPLGHRNHEKGLGVENTLKIGKRVWNPRDHVHMYKRMCTEALTVGMHSGPCTHMPRNREAFVNLFYYKIVVKGLQTFIKCVLSLGIILQGSQWQNSLL